MTVIAIETGRRDNNYKEWHKQAAVSVSLYGATLQALDDAWRVPLGESAGPQAKAWECRRWASRYARTKGFTGTQASWEARADAFDKQAKALERQSNKLRKQVHDIVIPALEALYPEYEFKFNWQAGCKCGCSPGYQIYRRGTKDKVTGFWIWVHVSADPDTYATEIAAEQAQLAKSRDEYRIKKAAVLDDGAGI